MFTDIFFSLVLSQTLTWPGERFFVFLGFVGLIVFRRCSLMAQMGKGGAGGADGGGDDGEGGGDEDDMPPLEDE